MPDGEDELKKRRAAKKAAPRKAPAKKAAAKKAPAKKAAPRKAPAKRAPRKPGPVPAVFRPEEEANKLRTAGYEWDEVAGLTGYPSGATARAAVFAWLQGAGIAESEAQRAQALAEELQRLNALMREWWIEATTKKNLDAAKFCLQIIAYRSKLRALERDVTIVSGGEVLVIAGSEEEYVAQLQRIANAG